MKKKLLISVLVIVIALGAITFLFVGRPYINAVKEYNKVVDVIKDKNSELDKYIKKVEQLINSKEKVVNDEVVTNAKATKKKAQASRVVLDSKPFTTKKIKEKTKSLKTPPDYTNIIEDLKKAINDYEISIKVYKQLTNPTEEFIIQRLQTIDEITDVSAVTEDNDPNGQLNKPGGYTATVYFSSSNVNQYEVYGNTLIDKGTDAGGAIEVYSKEEDAIKRRDYLAGFDGGILASGSHTVIGTVLIRTSDYLTATEQKNLEKKIIDAFSYIEGVNDIPQDNEPIEETNNNDQNESNSGSVELPPVNYYPQTEEPIIDDSQIYSVVGTFSGPPGSVTFNADGTLVVSWDSMASVNNGVPVILTGTWTQQGNTYYATVMDEDGVAFAPQSSIVYSNGIYWWDDFFSRVG